MIRPLRLRGLGLSSLAALAVGAVLPALGAGYTLVTKRRADGLALLVLATMVISISISLIVRDPRFLLARDGIITGLWGSMVPGQRLGPAPGRVHVRPAPAGGPEDVRGA